MFLHRHWTLPCSPATFAAKEYRGANDTRIFVLFSEPGGQGGVISPHPASPSKAPTSQPPAHHLRDFMTLAPCELLCNTSGIVILGRKRVNASRSLISLIFTCGGPSQQDAGSWRFPFPFTSIFP